ncbi:MAG: reverse transcriptase N-terminal domain-containing protein [Arsenophonus sp. NC-CH8-MAG3]
MALAIDNLKKSRNLQRFIIKSRNKHLLNIRKVTQINRKKYTTIVIIGN